MDREDILFLARFVILGIILLIALLGAALALGLAIRLFFLVSGV